MTSVSRFAAAVAASLWLVAFAMAASAAYLSQTMPASVPASAHSPQQALLLGVVITGATVGAFLVWRVPSNPVAWLLCADAIAFAAAGIIYSYQLRSAYGGDSGVFWRLVAAFGNVTWPLAIWLLAIYVPLLFPDGELPSRRWRWLPWAAGLGIALSGLGTAVDPNALNLPGLHVQNPIAIPAAQLVANTLTTLAAGLLLACLVGAAASVVVRYRRGSEQLRHQLKWFVAAVAFMVVSLLLAFWTNGSSFPGYLMALSLALLPVAIAFAVMRYRLYDIDLVINRALVYGALAAFITVVYVGVVIGIGQLLGTGGHPNLPLSIVATALVAVAFQPARTRLQKFANRVVFGRRATPYDALASFSRRLSGAVSAEDVLPRVAEAAGTALNVRGTRASLLLADGSERTAEWGTSDGTNTQTIEVRHEGELLGGIELCSNEPFADERTLRVMQNFANQAGAVFRNLRLTAELQSRLEVISRLTQELGASRHRIVAAAEEERRRLEAEISRTTRPQLDEITAGLRRARQLLETDPSAASDLLEELTQQASQALDGLRELARGVFPPLLIDKGVVSALQAHVRRAGSVELDVDPQLAAERFEPPIEAALYFSCVEALRGISAARIRLHGDGGWVECQVVPLGPQASTIDIRDRVEALGGSVNLDGGGQLDVKLPATVA